MLSSVLATLAGIALSYGGWRRGDSRAVLVGTAFTVMASLLLVHGFASPGFIVEIKGVVSLSGAATLPVGGVILALSALRSTRSPRAVTPLLWLQGALMVGVVTLGLIALWLPGLVPNVPDPASLRRSPCWWSASASTACSRCGRCTPSCSHAGRRAEACDLG